MQQDGEAGDVGTQAMGTRDGHIGDARLPRRAWPGDGLAGNARSKQKNKYCEIRSDEY
jgi:hypothetical protein